MYPTAGPQDVARLSPGLRYAREPRLRADGFRVGLLSGVGAELAKATVGLRWIAARFTSTPTKLDGKQIREIAKDSKEL